MRERGLAGGGGGGRALGLVGVMLLPIAAAYGIMARYAVDAPYIDDYPTILGFSLKYERLHGAGARLHYILADQWVEYKLVMIHLVSAALLGMTHHVSFSLLFWVGNLSLLPLLYVLWRSYFIGETDRVRRLVLFLPVAFLLFAMNYGEALDWTATALGYLGTLTLCLGAIELLAPGGNAEGSRRGGACVCALVACLMAANGFLLLPIGLFLLVPRRAYGWAGVWCGMFGVALLPYFVSYTRNARFGHGSVLLIPAFFLAFLGSALQFIPLAAAVGVMVLAVVAEAVRRGFWRTHPAAMLGVGWLLVSAALAAVGRGRTGLAFSVVSRYRIYSDLLLIFCYGYLAERVRNKRWVSAGNRRRLYAAALVGAVLLCVHGEYQAANILRGRRELLLAGAAYFREAPGEHSPMHFGVAATDAGFAAQERDAREWVEAAEREGLYRLPRGGR